MPKSAKNKLKPKGMVKSTHKITISVNFKAENFDALKTLRTNRSPSNSPQITLEEPPQDIQDGDGIGEKEDIESAESCEKEDVESGLVGWLFFY